MLCEQIQVATDAGNIRSCDFVLQATKHMPIMEDLMICLPQKS